MISSVDALTMTNSRYGDCTILAIHQVEYPVVSHL
ncbi:hypothetical protein BH24ACT16_BH24ACT16_08780 [soil metagenome]